MKQPRTIWLPVVGESFHQDALAAALRAHPDRHCRVVLRAEPTNPYDRHAVAVDCEESGAQFGHLSRKNAAELCSTVVRLPLPARCFDANLYGGESGKPSIGVAFDATSLIAEAPKGMAIMELGLGGLDWISPEEMKQRWNL